MADKVKVFGLNAANVVVSGESFRISADSLGSLESQSAEENYLCIAEYKMLLGFGTDVVGRLSLDLARPLLDEYVACHMLDGKPFTMKLEFIPGKEPRFFGPMLLGFMFDSCDLGDDDFLRNHKIVIEVEGPTGMRFVSRQIIATEYCEADFYFRRVEETANAFESDLAFSPDKAGIALLEQMTVTVMVKELDVS